MCFVVGALRRAVLIHARVVLSADDFYGRKSDQSLFPSIFFFFFYIYISFSLLFYLFSLEKRGDSRFDRRTEEYVSSLLEQLLLSCFRFFSVY